MRILALGIGAAHTTVAVLKQSMNEDGIDYLDMGAAYMRGDWDMAINGIWSPLYAWIIGGIVHIVDPPIRWEFPTVQITNFLIYVIALACFEFFWRQLTTRYAGRLWADSRTIGFHPAAWLILGYSLFIWSSLNLIEIWAVTPDMCVAAFVYLAAGLLLRLSAPNATPTTAILFGTILGGGYLAKAVMMPLGIVCLLLTVVVPGGMLGRWKRLILSTGAFLIIAGPFLVALSLHYGTLTFSDVGRFTYIKHVNEMRYPNFHGQLDRLAGTPEHPPRKIFDVPPVYEFARPVGGTYPMSYDPSYWTAGLKPTITAAQQLRAIITNAMAYFELFVRQQGGFLAVVIFLVALSVLYRLHPKLTDPEILLIVWALAALGLYSLVHVTPRYIAPFVVLFWSGLLGLIRLPDMSSYRRQIHVGALLLVSFVWINIAVLNLEGLGALAGFSPLSESGARTSQFSDGHKTNHPEIAKNLLGQGLKKGDEIGFIGYSFSAFWARLARLNIVAEIHPEDAATFWEANTVQQAKVLQAFSETGATAIVAGPVTFESAPHGWIRIGQTRYVLHLIQ
jgi:hypothetical protein